MSIADGPPVHGSHSDAEYVSSYVVDQRPPG